MYKKAFFFVGITLVSIFLLKSLVNINISNPMIKVGNKELSVEIAKSDEQKRLGLSNRKNLPQNSAMLFVFDKPGRYGIWMKDMNFPIDIAWIDKNRKIVHIEKTISPESYPKIFYPNEDALYVLETRAGFFDSLKEALPPVIFVF